MKTNKPQYHHAEQNGKTVHIYLNTGQIVTALTSSLEDYARDKTKGDTVEEYLDENWEYITKHYYDNELAK